MSNKGFTLVELLVTMVILGIIMGMVWPMVTNMQSENKKRKYKTFADSMVSAAKVYVDSYEDDLFYYDDDLTSESVNNGQCAIISYQDLSDHDLIKDVRANDTSCASPNTFVIVKRRKSVYKYNAYLGCGSSSKLDANSNMISSDDVSYVYPDADSPYVASKDTEPYTSLGCVEAVLK